MRTAIFGKSAFRALMTLTALTCAGIAVTAAPMPIAPKAVVKHDAKADAARLQPLAAGPAIQLARAHGVDDEDCVSVRKYQLADGRVQPMTATICNR